MQDTIQLKIEIISILDLLPIEGLKLLAEFVAFLQAKFKLSYTQVNVKELNDWQETLYLLSNSINAERLRDSIRQAELGKTNERALIEV